MNAGLPPRTSTRARSADIVTAPSDATGPSARSAGLRCRMRFKKQWRNDGVAAASSDVGAPLVVGALDSSGVLSD